jgi:hypothetical protein
MSLVTISTDRTLIAAMSPQERLGLLRLHIGNSVEAVKQASIVYAVMENAGDDITQVPLQLRNMLRRINSDHLIPEVVTNLCGRLRQKTVQLSLEDQQHILNNGTIPYLPAVDAQLIHIEAQRLTPDQINQVFGDGHIRNIEEQRAFILHRPKQQELASSRRSKPGRPANDVVVDKPRGGAVIHGRFVSKSQLLKIIAEL